MQILALGSHRNFLDRNRQGQIIPYSLTAVFVLLQICATQFKSMGEEDTFKGK